MSSPDDDLEQLLADVDFSRLRLDYGFTNALSLAVNYSFTLDEMSSAGFSDGVLSEVGRTALHETVHLYQMLGTSYGYYCQLLRDFQVNQIVLIVRAIRERFGVGPRMPIAQQVRNLPSGAAAEDIRMALRTWYLAELMLQWFEGHVDTFTHQSPVWGSLFDQPLVASYAELNWWLTRFVIETGRADLPAPAREITFAHDFDELGQRETPYLGMKIFGEDDAAGVLESAARAAEYWQQRGPVPAEMYGGDAGIPVDLIRYLVQLQYASQWLPTGDTHTFALTYGIIADTALNAPILPHHAGARNDRTELADLDPGSRLRLALGRAREITPVSDLSVTEHTRFVEELCDRCGWATPAQLGDHVLSGRPGNAPDVITDLYLYSVELRREHPHIFHDLDVWFVPKNPVTEPFTYYFSHPVMQFTDTVRLHNDQRMVSFFVQNYLVRSYLRRVLLSQDPTVTLPYAADEAEITTWSELLAATLTDVGFNRPRVTLRPGPARPPHHR